MKKSSLEDFKYLWTTDIADYVILRRVITTSDNVQIVVEHIMKPKTKTAKIIEDDLINDTVIRLMIENGVSIEERFENSNKSSSEY